MSEEVPDYTARALRSRSENEEEKTASLRNLLELIQSVDPGRVTNWQEFRRQFGELDAAFAVPKRRRWWHRLMWW